MELDPKGILGILWFLIAGITAYLRVFYGYTWLGWLYKASLLIGIVACGTTTTLFNQS